MNLVNESLETFCSTDVIQDETSFNIDVRAFKKVYKEPRQNVCDFKQLPLEIEPQDLNIKNKDQEALDMEMMICQECMDLRDQVCQLLLNQQRCKYQKSSNKLE